MELFHAFNDLYTVLDEVITPKIQKISQKKGGGITHKIFIIGWYEKIPNFGPWI